jgi:hypothetical protein
VLTTAPMSSDRYEDLGHSRHRRRRHRYVPVRLNRRMEIWAVVVISLAILGASLSWMLSQAYPTGQQGVTSTSPGAGQDDQSSQSQPAVIILEDKSGARNDPPAR